MERRLGRINVIRCITLIRSVAVVAVPIVATKSTIFASVSHTALVQSFPVVRLIVIKLLLRLAQPVKLIATKITT